MLGLPGGNQTPENDWDAGTFAYSGESFDRMIFAAGAESFDHSTPPHEFAHGLGGEHSPNPQALLFGGGSAEKLTNEDFQQIFGSAIDSHIKVQQQMQGQYPYARTQPTMTTHTLRVGPTHVFDR